MLGAATLDTPKLVVFESNLGREPVEDKRLVYLADQHGAGYIPQVICRLRDGDLGDGGDKLSLPGGRPYSRGRDAIVDVRKRASQGVGRAGDEVREDVPPNPTLGLLEFPQSVSHLGMGKRRQLPLSSARDSSIHQTLELRANGVEVVGKLVSHALVVFVRVELSDIEVRGFSLLL